MSAKHTPGEWELRHERHLGKTTHVVKIGTASVYFNRGIGQTEEEAVANGKLIASAPELLAALEALLEQADLGEVDEETKPIVDQARAAIRKATGNI